MVTADTGIEHVGFLSHARRKRPSLSKLERQELVKGILFISPWIIGFLAFTVYPLGSAIYFSLSIYDILRPPLFVGLENFVELAQDRFFYNSVANTLSYAVLAVPMSLVAAFFLALLLNRRVRWRPAFRTVFYLPSVVPVFVTAQIWRWIYHQQYGLVNQGLQAIGLAGIPWLSSPDWAKFSLAIISIWGCGGAMLIFLAALQDVPKELIEVAQLDGASGFQQVLYITIPMVSPQILLLLLLGFIGAFQSFDLAQIMTGGAPVRSTEFMVMYMYRMAFGYQRMGYAAAIAWVVFFLTMIVAVVVFGTVGRWVYYAGESRERP